MEDKTIQSPDKKADTGPDLQAIINEERRLRANQFARIMLMQLENRALRRTIDGIVAEHVRYRDDAILEMQKAQLREQGWEATAAMFSRNADYYRGLLVECGDSIGEDAFTCDDGSLASDVLVAKVPELVEELCRPKYSLLRLLGKLFGVK